MKITKHVLPRPRNGESGSGRFGTTGPVRRLYITVAHSLPFTIINSPTVWHVSPVGPHSISPMPESHRVHSLGGCKTCRRRHIKCDKSRPVCRQCANRSLACGYSSDIRWMPPSGDPNNTTSKTEQCESIPDLGTRHYLYSGNLTAPA